MKVAIVEFEQAAILRLLCLPETSKIHGCLVDGDTDKVLLKIEHDDLPDVCEGNVLPTRAYEIAGDRGYACFWGWV